VRDLRGSLAVVNHRSFRLLWLGQTASAIGDQVVIVALALFITNRTGSATDLGVVLAAGSLPMMTLLLFGGVWADRLPRHRIMIVCDVARAALHTLLAVLILTGEVEIWQIVLLEAAFGAARAFFQPAYTGLIPQTVPEDGIQQARALTQASESIATLVGPALATVLVLGVGAGEAFLFDAATFVLSAVLLAGVHPRARGAERVASTVLHELRAGWREVASRPWVWATISAFSGMVLFVYAPWYTLVPGISRDVYGSSGVFGLLESIAGAGAVIAAAVGVVWRPRRPLVIGLLLVELWPATCIAAALAAPLALVLALSFASGVGFGLMLIVWEVALAEHIPPGALSRVSAYDWMGSMALMPLGFALAGPLAASFGAREVLGAGGVVGLVLVALALLPRTTRTLGHPVLESAPSAEQLAG
jgi:MFS family permease